LICGYPLSEEREIELFNDTLDTRIPNRPVLRIFSVLGSVPVTFKASYYFVRQHDFGGAAAIVRRQDVDGAPHTLRGALGDDRLEADAHDESLNCFGRFENRPIGPLGFPSN
jgi:hypothetical protein